mgnify:CR=1 FL=1|tara:strand:+ start:616 stop:2505 length:1890 start_codon:yes stop_codon:yes gene_type:complete
MAIVQIKGSDQKVRFPNNMIEDQMLTALRSQYPRTLNQNIGDALNKPESTISNRDVSLAENTKQKIANFLFDNKIVSDRYGAQRIGDNLSSLLGVLPGIGDAQAGDEFGRAVAEGDGLGIGMGALAALPIVGDAASKGAKKLINPLIKMQNTTEGALLKTNELGGLASPSIAIANPEKGFESFGDISLVAKSDAFTKDPTFASDVYSPRFPNVSERIDTKAARAEADRLTSAVDPRIDSNFDSQFYTERLSEDISRLRNSTGNRAAFLDEIGQGVNPDNYLSTPAPYDVPQWFNDLGLDINSPYTIKNFTDGSDFSSKSTRFITDLDPQKEIADWWDNEELTRDGKMVALKSFREVRNKSLDTQPKYDKFSAVNEIDKRISENKDLFNTYLDSQKSRISRGKVFTKWNPDTAQSKEFQYNLKNAVKLMKGNIRGGENFNYGVGSIRSQVTPQLKSLNEIKNKRGMIVGEDEMTLVKEETESMFDNLYDSLSSSWAYSSDPSYSDFADGISQAARGDFSDFKNLNKEQKAEMNTFFNNLANAPTNYFEIKPQRAVSLSEFYGAVVPEGTSPKVIKQLEDEGLKVAKYTGDRRDAISALNTDSGGKLFFSAGGVALVYAGSQPKEKDEKDL